MQNLLTSVVERIEALRANSYFSTLDERMLQQLSEAIFLRRYSAGEVVCWQGEECSGFFIIKQGSVKLFKLSPKGRELIIKVFTDRGTFNEVPVFDLGTNVVNVAALESSDIWVVEANAIHQILKKDPEIAAAVIANLSQNLRMLVNMVEELSFYQVTNRLARLISQLPAEQVDGLALQHITQDQLAARLGTVREVVARSLRDLERCGAIRVQRRQIEVVNLGLLREWAQEPSGL